MRTKILIIGASGMLGVSLSKYLNNQPKKYIVYKHSNNEKGSHRADLTNLDSTNNLLNSLKPDTIVNLAALTDVDLCEKEVDKAYRINVRIVENISLWMKNNRETRFVQVSTDHFYESSDLSKEDNTHISNMYAMTKYAAELACNTERTTILRTNFIGKSEHSKRKSFTDWLYNSLINKQEISVLEDVYFSPLSISDLCKNIALVIDDNKNGIFNLGSVGKVSKSDVCLKMAKYLNLPIDNVSKIESKDALFLKTDRPNNMGMNCDKFIGTFDVDLPGIDDTLTRVFEEYK